MIYADANTDGITVHSIKDKIFLFMIVNFEVIIGCKRSQKYSLYRKFR